MKKLLLVAIILLPFTFHLSPCFAQHDGRHPEKKRPTDITELVDDLSAPQKHKIDNISKESKVRVEALRRQRQAVRDSIRLYMELEGDQSKLLYPLFDREAQLQAAVSREMYSAKLRIDEVLTKEQRATLRKATRLDVPAKHAKPQLPKPPVEKR